MSMTYGLTLVLMVFFIFAFAALVAYGVWYTTFVDRPLTYFEVLARRILSSAPERLVAERVDELVALWSQLHVLFREQTLFAEPGAAVELRYPCPLGVRVYVSVEPGLELVSHAVAPDGTCTTAFHNPAGTPILATVTVYSKGSELMADEAFRTYIVLKWVSENLRYRPDPHGSEILFTPADTIKRGGGDCEDLALVTAVMLRALDVNAGIAMVNTGTLGYVADHVAVAVKPTSSNFMTNLRVYFDVTTVPCGPIVIRGYVILDPTAAVSSIIPWCVSYTYSDVRSITTANEHIHLLKLPP